MRLSSATRADLRAKFHHDGFALLPKAVEPQLLRVLRRETDRLLAESGKRGGLRNLLSASHVFVEESTAGLPAQVARCLLGHESRPTKLTLFDKSPEANWLISWHQDLFVAVQERRQVRGFGAWSMKEGIHHVQPPTSVLESIAAVRIHLDDTPSTNGALRVVPGSHRSGKLGSNEIARLRRDRAAVTCELGRGGAMLMSPLLLHSSSKAVAPRRRRVLHFEFSATDLPDGLRWPDCEA